MSGGVVEAADLLFSALRYVPALCECEWNSVKFSHLS